MNRWTQLVFATTCAIGLAACNTMQGAGKDIEVFLRRAAGAPAEEVAAATIATPKNGRLRLRIRGAGPNYSFYYDAGTGWQPLRENDDGTLLSTEKAGGFVGTVIGPYAQERWKKP